MILTGAMVPGGFGLLKRAYTELYRTIKKNTAYCLNVLRKSM